MFHALGRAISFCVGCYLLLVHKFDRWRYGDEGQPSRCVPRSMEAQTPLPGEASRIQGVSLAELGVNYLTV